jgi:nicotinate-nucleotide adenylyltransferase
VEALREMYPDAELILLMGTDMFLSFHTWRQPERITKHATLGVFYRGEKGEKEKIQACRAEMEKAGAKVELLENKAIFSSELGAYKFALIKFYK